YVQLLQKENNTYKEATCEFYQPYLATGDVSGFVQTLPREVVLITKHQPNETYPFLLLGSGPVSTVWEEDVVLEQTDILLKKLAVGSSLLLEVGKAYDITLKPMSETPPQIADAFFSMPLLYASITTNAHFTTETGNAPANGAASGHMGALPGEFVLGTTSAQMIVKEPVSFFKKTGVFNARPEHRKHLLQVIAEGALFSNIPVVIVDWEDEFSVMRAPNPESRHLKEQKIEGDPIGFPVKEFTPPENLKIDLSTLSPEGLAEALGLTQTDVGKLLIQFLKENKTESIDQAKGLLKQLPPTETFTAFHANSIARILTLLDTTFPGLFTGTNPVEEISKSWYQSIGRVGILKLKNVAPKMKNLLVYSILNGIYTTYQRKGASNRTRSLIVIPEAQHLFEGAREPVLHDAF
ncbi:MAG: DUF87 domain-containing protein, partial [archaeon]